MPCEEPGCTLGGHLLGWRSLSSRPNTLDLETDQLTARVIEAFGEVEYRDAVIRAIRLGRGDTRATNVALRDELKRLVEPH